LTIDDDFTKESVDIIVDHGISGLYVARALDRAARFRGYPKAVRTDQGPEFTSRVLDQWAYANGVALKLIQPGKPTQNAYIESFNGKFRDECLNEHWFTTLAQARAVIAAWRQDYNETRPHSALNTCRRLNLQQSSGQQRSFLPLYRNMFERTLLEARWPY
jgi:putative transposase